MKSGFVAGSTFAELHSVVRAAGVLAEQARLLAGAILECAGGMNRAAQERQDRLWRRTW